MNRSLTPLSPALYSRRPKPTFSPAGQSPFPHHRVNDDGFHDPGRLPSTSALLTEPATHSPTLPSCDELPACVHFGALSRSEARPSEERRLFTYAARGATRRSFDFCNQNDPRARPIELFEPCPPRVRSPSRAATTAGGAAIAPRFRGLRCVANRASHGSGAAKACASARLLRRRSLAFRSFAPTRSTRTPLVANS